MISEWIDSDKVAQGESKQLEELDNQDGYLHPVRPQFRVPIFEASLVYGLQVSVLATKKLFSFLVVASLSRDQVEVDAEDKDEQRSLERAGRRVRASGGSNEDYEGNRVGAQQGNRQQVVKLVSENFSVFMRNGRCRLRLLLVLETNH